MECPVRLRSTYPGRTLTLVHLEWRLLLALLTLAFASVATASDEPVRLVDGRRPGEIQRVKVVLEARGELKASEEAKPAPMSVTAQAIYDEQWFGTPEQPASVRKYEKFLAKIQVGDTSEQTELPVSKQVIAVQATDPAKPTLYSLRGHLSRRELDALQLPGNSALVGGLLPTNPVRPGDAWIPETTALAGLLQLDTITGPEMKCKLVDVDRGLARVQLSGNVIGRVAGATTGLEITGELRYDLGTRLVRWLQLKIREERNAGPISPALQAVVELRMLIEEAPQTNREGFPDKLNPPTAQELLLEFVSEDGGLRFLHERQWAIVADGSRTTILRWLEDGRALAQCNLNRLPSLPAGKQLGLEEFQEDIRQSLKGKFREFEVARQDERKDGAKTLQVVAAGQADGEPAIWVYHHVASTSGDRAALVCTMAADNYPAKSKVDRLMVGTLQFTKPFAELPKSTADKAAAEQARNPTYTPPTEAKR